MILDFTKIKKIACINEQIKQELSRQELSLYWSVFVIENSWRTSALIRQIAHINKSYIFISQ